MVQGVMLSGTLRTYCFISCLKPSLEVAFARAWLRSSSTSALPNLSWQPLLQQGDAAGSSLGTGSLNVPLGLFGCLFSALYLRRCARSSRSSLGSSSTLRSPLSVAGLAPAPLAAARRAVP